MASDVDATQDFVIFASFENRHAAEHMLVSLGRRFRKKHRKRHATALVIHGNKDGSLTTDPISGPDGGGFVSTLTRISLSWTVGFIGIASTLHGTKAPSTTAATRKSHVGSDEQSGP